MVRTPKFDHLNRSRVLRPPKVLTESVHQDLLSEVRGIWPNTVVESDVVIGVGYPVSGVDAKYFPIKGCIDARLVLTFSFGTVTVWGRESNTLNQIKLDDALARLTIGVNTLILA